MAGDLISLLERIARVHADTTLAELEQLNQRRAVLQERAARDAVRPHSGNVVPLGSRRAPIHEEAPAPCQRPEA